MTFSNVDKHKRNMDITLNWEDVLETKLNSRLDEKLKNHIQQIKDNLEKKLLKILD